MTARVPILCALLVILLESCSGWFLASEREDFIRVQGTRFMHNGKPYYFTGTNLWYGCYLGSPGSTGDRERLVRELDSMCAIGLENLRILGASEESYIKRSIKPGIQQAPGKVDDSLLVGLDFLLAEMAKRRMHAVIYLNNYWEWSGGMSQYNVWADGVQGADPEDPVGGYRAFMEFSAQFYANPKANELFRDYLKTVITRTNTCNDRSYAADPTIMAWQLANEPRPGTNGLEGERNLPEFNHWIDQTAQYIHSLDTNHLVSTGSEGTVGFRWSDEYFLNAHNFASVDYLTFHLWPKNWGWFDPKRFEETLPSSEVKALEYIDKHLAFARQLRKPIVMEEFGMARDSAKCKPGTPTTARDRYYARVLEVLFDSARAGAPIAGTNFWTWGGEGRGAHPDDIWRKGDPFVGDPPQEPQGFNSIFIGDRSTIQLLRNHATMMKGLGIEAAPSVAGMR